MLPEAHRLGIDPALVTWDSTNIASRRIIEANGGVLENEVERGGAASPETALLGSYDGRLDPSLTNRDFYQAITAFQTSPCGSNRSLEQYLRALRQLCLALEHLPALSGEAFLHLLEVAFTAEVPPFPEEWRTHSGAEDAGGFAGFDATLIRQVVDLRDLAESGALENEYRYFGLNAPSGHRWYNFTPSGYLECAVQGMYGGWDPDDDTGRMLVPGPVAVIGEDGELTTCDPRKIETPIAEVAAVTWDDFREFLFYGQIYE